MLGGLSQAYWRFLPAERRAALAPRVERVLRAGLTAAKTPSLKGSYFSTLRDIALTKPTLDVADDDLEAGDEGTGPDPRRER